MTPSEPSKILAVEDNPETQLLLRHLLEPNHEVVLVSGVEEAVEAFENQLFDLLLLDINLGEQRTGVDLLGLLQDQAMQPIPAIALTAYAMPGDRENFLEAGFDAYISKPFTRDGLFEVIDSAMDTARAQDPSDPT